MDLELTWIENRGRKSERCFDDQENRDIIKEVEMSDIGATQHKVLVCQFYLKDLEESLLMSKCIYYRVKYNICINFKKLEPYSSEIICPSSRLLYP